MLKVDNTFSSSIYSSRIHRSVNSNIVLEKLQIFIANYLVSKSVKSICGLNSGFFLMFLNTVPLRLAALFDRWTFWYCCNCSQPKQTRFIWIIHWRTIFGLSLWNSRGCKMWIWNTSSFEISDPTMWFSVAK